MDGGWELITLLLLYINTLRPLISGFGDYMSDRSMCLGKIIEEPSLRKKVNKKINM